MDFYDIRHTSSFLFIHTYVNIYRIASYRIRSYLAAYLIGKKCVINYFSNEMDPSIFPSLWLLSLFIYYYAWIYVFSFFLPSHCMESVLIFKFSWFLSKFNPLYVMLNSVFFSNQLTFIEKGFLRNWTTDYVCVCMYIKKGI